MKWFFALCNKSKDCSRTIDHLKVAVNSAKKHTDLKPYFLYDGEEDELTEWMKKKGVSVYITQVTFLNLLENNPKIENIGTARGAYLRVEVPLLMRHLKMVDKYVLYTDCDVIFTKDSTDIFKLTPEYFAAAPEFNIDNYSYINTGVMIMNVHNMFKTRLKFIEYIQHMYSNTENAPDYSQFDWYDQSMYNEFYKGKIEPLDPVYNWKPYWGHNPKAKIIHFHGPKIDTIRSIRSINVPDILLQLYITGQASEGYDKYIKLFDGYSK